MSVLVVVFVIVGAALWIRARRRRAVTLSGTSAAAPVFSVEPPQRRLTRQSGDRL